MKFTSTNKLISIEVLDNILHYFKTGERKQCEIPQFLCEGFCLFAGLVALNLQEEDFSFYENDVRDEKIKNNLLKINKHKNKNNEELKEFISKNNKIDIRNAFYHGNFEIIQDEGFNWFMLEPQRPHNPSSFPIAITFNEIYNALGKKFIKVREAYFKNTVHNEEEQGAFLFNFLALPFIEMARFYSDKKMDNYQTKDIIVEYHQLLGQYLLNILNITEQNELIPYLKDDSKKAKLCLFRNSGAHGLINIDKNKMKFVDFNPKTMEKKEISLNSNKFRKEVLKIHATALMGLIEEFDREIDSLASAYQNENLKSLKDTHKKAEKVIKDIMEYAEEKEDE